MVRRVFDLTSDGLEALPDRCRSCRFWELGASRPIDVEAHLDSGGSVHGLSGGGPQAQGAGTDTTAGGTSDDALVEKCAWWRSVELEFGPSGRAVRVDAEVAAWCLFGPPEVFARRPAHMPRPSSDALLLATVWVERPFRGEGLGPLLLRTVIKEALRRDRRAVEAYGDRRHREAGCLLPVTWLLHEGFAVHREHPRYPLLRLDVHSTVRWSDSIEQMLEQASLRFGRRTQPELSP